MQELDHASLTERATAPNLAVEKCEADMQLYMHDCRRLLDLGAFEREGQRWMTASTTSCVPRHGGEVAASNPALLTYTRTPRLLAACHLWSHKHGHPRSGA